MVAREYISGVSKKAIGEVGDCSDGSYINESFLNDSQVVLQFDDILSPATHGDGVASSEQADEVSISDELRLASSVLADALNNVFPGMFWNVKPAFLMSKLTHF